MSAQQSRLFQHMLRATKCPRTALRACALVAAGIGSPRSRRPARPKQDQPCDFDLERAALALESEAVRRALDGVQLPVFHQGRECGNTVKHSDQLLMFLLKTLRPARYAPPREASSPEQRPLELDIDLSAADQDDASTEHS